MLRIKIKPKMRKLNRIAKYLREKIKRIKIKYKKVKLGSRKTRENKSLRKRKIKK